METTTKKNTDKNKIIIIVLLLLLIAVCAFLGFTLLGQDDGPSEYEEKVNAITEIDYEERQAALNQIVEDGMINIQYASGAVFNGKVSESFNVKNIENNHHPLVFKILDPDGKVIYESKKIEPGYEINKIELQKGLPKGTHECRIVIGYAEEGNVSSSFPITITVK